MADREKMTIPVLILIVFFVLLIGFRAKKDRAVQSKGPRLDSQTYAARGPHWVGTRDLVLEGEKTQEMIVWYPALNGANPEEETSYPYEIKMGSPFGTVPISYFVGQAAQEASYDLSQGPYPLVILSPGFSIGSSAYAWLAEHLASYGFVVVSPEHREHLDPENELWRAAVARPKDILSVLAYIDRQVKTGGELEGLVDPEIVAVVGHSYGGYTALAAGGAQLDTVELEAYCQSASEPDDPGGWLCQMLIPYLTDMADLADLDTVPERLWPAWADPRVDATVSLAGDAFFFGQNGLAKLTVPVMAMGGTADSDSPYLWGTHPTYEYASSPRKIRIALNNAEHMIFTGPCESIPLYLKFFSGEFCADPDWDRLYAHDLTNHFTTAFLLSELKQHTAAATVLAPEGIHFPDITYDALGY